MICRRLVLSRLAIWSLALVMLAMLVACGGEKPPQIILVTATPQPTPVVVIVTATPPPAPQVIVTATPWLQETATATAPESLFIMLPLVGRSGTTPP